MAARVDDKTAIVQRIQDARQRLAELGVQEIGLFGSFARGEQTPTSDIDVLVQFAPEQHTYDNFVELAFLLEDLLGRHVELVTRESLSPYIGPHILREVERVSVAP